MRKILILYSNPSDSERIRLDKEHRAIDEAIALAGASAQDVIRRHATTFGDLVKCLADDNYSVVHFSGHGSAKGIFLEASESDDGEVFCVDRVVELLKSTQPNLNLVLFMSCYSAEAIPILIKAAPCVITVFGSAYDEAAIKFVKNFYLRYLMNESVGRAFFLAQEVIRDTLEVVLTRRALGEREHKVLFEVFPRGNHWGDSFLIDLSEAESDIQALDVSRETFLSLLTRKIRLHTKIFDLPRERVMLPIGYYFGVFSWQNALDVIVCHQILRVKQDVDENACALWVELAVIYNDDAIGRYRSQSQPAAAHNEKILSTALKNYRSSFNRIFGNKDRVGILQKHVPDQYKVTKSVMQANLDMAETKLVKEELESVVFHLECALSAEHDLFDALARQLAVNYL